MTSNHNTNENKNHLNPGKNFNNTKDKFDKTTDQSAKAAYEAREGVSKIVDLNERAAQSTQQLMQESLETASNQARDVGDQLSRAFGYTGEDSERLAQQSKQNMEAVAHCGTVFTQAFQDASRIWLDLGQKQWQRNLDGLNKLARTKSVQEFSAIQSELVREGLQSMIQDGKAITETSARAVEEASKTFSSITEQGSAPAR